MAAHGYSPYVSGRGREVHWTARAMGSADVAIWIILSFLAVPIIEIALFVKIGGAIGLLPTLGIVVLSAILGTYVIRLQGLRALERLRASAQSGGDPVGPIAHGALTFFAGILLILPGFFTDTLGLLLLIPQVRALLIGWGASRVTVRAASFVQARRGSTAPGGGETIEADYEIVDDGGSRRRGTSGWTRPMP
jgi:UPF0716 protein FxsA